MNLPPPTERQARMIWLALTGLAVAVLVALVVALIWGAGPGVAHAFAGAVAHRRGWRDCLPARSGGRSYRTQRRVAGPGHSLCVRPRPGDCRRRVRQRRAAVDQ